MSSPVDLYKAAKYAEAITAIDNMPQQPLEPAFMNLKGVCFMRGTNVESALECFDAVLSADPNNGEAAANKKGALMLQCSLSSDAANALFRSGDFDGALVKYSSIDLELANTELKFQVLNNIGAIHMEKRDPRMASDYFKKALAVEGKSTMVDTIHNLATALKGIGSFVEALQYFDSCIAEQPEFYSALCGRIEVLNSLSRFDEAIEASNKAIKVKPDEYRAYADRGFSNLKRGEVDAAILDFEGAMERGSRNSADLMKVYCLAVSVKGDKLLNSQRFAEAATAYEKALSIGNSDTPPAAMLFNYSLSLLHSGRKDEAIVNMQHTVEVAPDFFNAWAAMGLAFLQDEKYEKCIKALTEAVRVKPEEVEVMYHLGVAYLKSNMLVEAVDTFRKVLTINPAHEPSQKALSMVEAR